MIEGILPILKRYSGCDYHRVILPLKYLGFDVDSVPQRSTEELLKETKLLLFNRIPENKEEDVLKYKKKYGFKICLDLDDFWILNINHPMYKIWQKNKMSEQIIKWINHADAITVTTSKLADKVKLLNKNVYIIPNGLPFDDGQFTATKTESNFTRFIYTGGSSHLWDIKLLKIPFSKLPEMSEAQFILAGYNDKDPKIWTRMEHDFTVGGKIKNYERRNGLPLDSYMKVYRDADVSLTPLENNTFTPYKSNIKFLEAGCKNIPVISSNVPPYSDEPNKNVIMYASNVREWVHHIKYCHENKHFVNEKGKELGEYVRKNYDLRVINEYRKQLFEHLMS